VWGFIVAGHHALLAPLFIHLGLLLAGTALLIRFLLLLLARLLLTTAALLLIALIGHQVAPWFDKRKTLAQVRRSFATAMANRRFPTLSMGDWELLGIAAHSRLLLARNLLPPNAPPVAAWTGLSKKLNAPYRSGPSRIWIKVKNPRAPAATRIIDGTF
jgi:hypothetical protein